MVQIADAAAHDIAAIQQVLRETWEDTYSDHLSRGTLDEVYSTYQSREFLTKQIENPACYFPLATAAGELVGLATAIVSEDSIVLFRLYISPRHQRHGIGERLLNAVIEHFQGAARIQLSVEAMNPKAQSFYTKHGFKEIRREDERIVDETIELILMEKQL